MKFYDIHTHCSLYESINCSRSRIFSISPFEFENAQKTIQQGRFSCGVHPWDCEDIDTQLIHLTEIASDSRIIAIGETGLDKLKGAAFDVQIPLFKQHIELSEKFNKPLIIHCVKAWNELIYIRRETNPTQPWIIHGFRGNPELTKQLVKEGFQFSMGAIINADSIPIIPIHSLFCETDESEKSICDVYRQVADVMCVDIEMLVADVAKNVGRVFPELVVE